MSANQAYVPNRGGDAFPITIPPEVRPDPQSSGSGSPEGVVPANPGTGYLDNDTSDFWVKFAGVQTLGWRRVGKMIVIPTEDVNGSTSSVASMYRLKSVEDDYVTCRSWDGAEEGAADVLVAKEPNARSSIITETILGVVHTYTYSAGGDAYNVVRSDFDGEEITDLTISPAWKLNEVIMAIPATTGVTASGAAVGLLMIRTALWKPAGLILS